jgi:hypothetical protein
MTSDKLAKLIEQRKAIDAQIKLEQNRENEKKKKDDTRRKILTGAAVLDEAAKHPKFKADIDKLLGRFLKRNDERALFGLPPLPVHTAANNGAEKTDTAGPGVIPTSQEKQTSEK